MKIPAPVTIDATTEVGGVVASADTTEPQVAGETPDVSVAGDVLRNFAQAEPISAVPRTYPRAVTLPVSASLPSPPPASFDEALKRYDAVALAKHFVDAAPTEQARIAKELTNPASPGLHLVESVLQQLHLSDVRVGFARSIFESSGYLPLPVLAPCWRARSSRGLLSHTTRRRAAHTELRCSLSTIPTARASTRLLGRSPSWRTCRRGPQKASASLILESARRQHQERELDGMPANERAQHAADLRQLKRRYLNPEQTPGLTTQNFELIGPPDTYDCISYSVGITDRMVIPGPEGPPTLDATDGFYAAHGFVVCPDAALRPEPGFETVVLYGRKGAPKHAAVSRGEADWESKLGNGPLIRHRDLRILKGDTYGKEILRIYKRPLLAAEVPADARGVWH